MSLTMVDDSAYDRSNRPGWKKMKWQVTWGLFGSCHFCLFFLDVSFFVCFFKAWKALLSVLLGYFLGFC